MTEYLPPSGGLGLHPRMLDEEVDALEQTAIPGFLRDPVGILRRRFSWMLLALLVGISATTVAVLLTKPRYLASAEIQVTGQRIPENLVRSTVQERPLARINSMMGTILSRREIAAMIEKHNLYPDLRESKTLAEIVEMTRDDITIEEKPTIGGGSRGHHAEFYIVSFEADDPEAAAAVANEIAARITDESIRSRNREATMTTEFLRSVLEKAEAELRAQNQKIREFKERHRGELPSELMANLSKMDRLQLQRQSLSIQIGEAETRLATLATSSASQDGDARNSPEAQLLALEQQLAQQLTTRTERHPSVVTLRRDIEARRLDLDLATPEAAGTPPSRRSLLRAAQRTIARLKAQLADTEERLKILDARVAGTPAREEVLIAMEEREGVLREAYLEFLRKVQDAELSQNLESAQQGERFSVVDPAVTPTSPSPRWMYAGLGGLMSLALALGVGILLEFIDPVLLTTEQLESISDLPALGSVARI